MLTYLLLLALTGLIVGGLARLALPGPDPMGVLATIGLGLAGSFIAGLIVYAIAGDDGRGPGILLSVLCATGLMYLVRRSRGQGLESTRRRPGHMAR
ncbi:GlsB/YeaQ/YmgE family stress response membrane protein [Conexibacter sp. SYSU D00693]|uniref:GlsB/YeaQ/YmgE family stress response membrane protein n=1 Tax=Conexibacter sp. SYSU D00693 TaxID=2812560 RepID=UPI00196A9AED|nr:hypothetical protein [Conexibacter sp. SYSU D00693]